MNAQRNDPKVFGFVEPDARRRVAVGRYESTQPAHYSVSTADDGTITLTPVRPALIAP